MDIKQILINLIGEVLGILLLLVVFLAVLLWAKLKADKTQLHEEEVEKLNNKSDQSEV